MNYAEIGENQRLLPLWERLLAAVGGLETYDSPYFGFASIPVYPVK